MGGGVVTLDEACALIRTALPAACGGGAEGVEEMDLASALGRVLARDALAPTDLPPFDRSLVDGWALQAGGPTRLPVGGEVRMGAPAPPLRPGTAFAMPTGGMLPAGADAVVMLEDARLLGGQVELIRPTEAGAHVIHRGTDARRGDVVVPAGRRLRPFELAMLAAAGVARVGVRRRPRVALLSTGDELDTPPAVPGEGRVPDANGPALAASLQRDGCVPVFLGLVPDDRDALCAAVSVGLQHGGLICTGGSSVGERDFVQEVLADALGVAPLFSGVAVRPGRPTAVFVADARWAVALPGHTVSALVVYELLLREALLRWGGETRPRARGFIQAVLADAVRAPADRELVARIRIDQGVGTPRAVPLFGPSAAVGTLALADGLLRCPAGGSLAVGALVRVLSLD